MKDNKFKRLGLALMLLFLTAITSYAQSMLTTKVYAKAGTNKYFGKLYVPKGSKWRIAMHPSEGVDVEVYSGNISSGSDIYMRSTDPQFGYYWIDAEETDHILIVRSTSNADVVAESVTPEMDAEFLSTDSYYYDKDDKKRNKFQYTPTAIASDVLKTNKTYNTKSIYVMANPEKYGLAFVKLDPEITNHELAKKSLYVLTKKSSAARLNIIFEDEEVDLERNNTAIQTIETELSEESPIFTIQGIRVTTPHKGELYIRNGKKFIAK